jgi:type I restriction enzyme S subunit
MTNSVTQTVEAWQKAGVLLVEDGNHGEYRPRPTEFVSEGTAFIRAADLESGRVRFDSASKINPTAVARITKGIGRPGDVLFSHKGTVGKLAVVPTDAPPFVCSPQTTFWRVADTKILNSRYLYYYMQSWEFRQQWEACKAETDMADYVSLTAQRRLKVAIPSLDKQRCVVQTLGALDDKIELNRQMNQTLEAMARALFKSWFVDFDPVVAKREGRRTSWMDTELFPSHFQESELGPIPRGWTCCPIVDVMDINPQRGLKHGEVAPYLEMQAVPTTGYAPIDWKLRAAGSGARFMNGDTLLARITPCLENGKMAYVDFLDEGQIAWGSTEYIVMRPRDPIPHIYAYLLARHEDFRDHAIRSMTGSSGRQRVASDDLARYTLAGAPSEIYEAFGSIVKPWFALAKGNMNENRTLARLRDLLLPRLLASEVCLKDAEELVGEAV